MSYAEMKRPIRILASQDAIPVLASKLNDRASFSYELLESNRISPGTEFDVALISRDVTALSTKRITMPSTQEFYNLLLGSKDLSWVQIHSAGADRQIYLDLMNRGVTISGSSGVNAQVVMQTAIAGILMLARHFPKMLEAQRQKRWDSLINYPLPADLSGQTAVIVGRGPIGNGITKILIAMGVRCIQMRFSEGLGVDALQGAESRHISELKFFLGEANWLVLACPLTSLTRQLIDSDAINLLPQSAYIVNIARGEIIDEDALIEALRSKKLAGAYLDVFASEPLNVSSPLWDLDNVIVTPHSAGHSLGNESRVMELFLENLTRLHQGEALKNTIAA